MYNVCNLFITNETCCVYQLTFYFKGVSLLVTDYLAIAIIIIIAISYIIIAS